MIGPAFTIAAVLALSATVDAARCRYTKDKLPGKIEKYNKCLSIGFDPSIEGCVKVVREGHKLRRNDNRKCAELERYLMKCGHMCAAPVDGGWSDFGDWSECSAECDGGVQTRARQCDNPAPDHGGADCEGEDSETQECNTDPCPVDGGWSDFGDWSECSDKCDGGVQTRTRQCDNPAPEFGGAECEGEEGEVQECNTHDCLECDDPNSDYNKCAPSSCIKTCRETCEKPMVVHDNKFLSFDFGGEEECVKQCECHMGFVLHLGECILEQFCPVDGGLGNFGDWSECSDKCGGGVQNRTRQCDNPAPAFGGADCEWEEEIQMCNTDPCPVDGGWSDFGDRSECSDKCDGGVQTRTRQCDNPAPEHGGADCEGEAGEAETCNTHDCLECDDPNSDYNKCAASSCIKTCSETCEQSIDFGGEEECVKQCECHMGFVLHLGECIQELFCPVDGGLGDFGDWSECSDKCGGGVQKRTRQCDNPAPAFGGADCEWDEEIQMCNTDPCTVDGGWGEFGDWSECGAECGGTQSRSRECNNPTPVQDGADCEGDAEETRDCPCRKLTSAYGMEAHNNIAASGTASQFNSAYKGFADLAIDGDTNGDFEAGSVTHTRNAGEDMYWKLVFESPQYIDNVVVWGRTDCCERRIDGAKFCIDDVEMGELLSDQMSEDKEEFEVNSFGREILIKGPRGKLSLAEVEVFGMKFEFKNIADDAVISAEGVGGGAYQREMSWDSPRHINSIVLNYQKSSSMEGFDGTRVYVGETEVGQVEAQDGKMAYIFGGLEGSHSQVRIVGSEAVMNLADVEIYGE